MGIKIDNQLKFAVHIQSVVKKAYQRLGVLFRGFVSRDPKLLTLAYITYIRPILEYCSVVWSPFLLKDIDVLEGVQRYFTRRIAGLKIFGYKERLHILDLESLEERRLKNDLVMCYKIMNNLVDLELVNFFKLSNGVTRGHSQKIVKPLVKNSKLQNLFQNRVVDSWNFLPNHIVTSKSIKSFKNGLNTINFDLFLIGRALVD